MSTSPSDAPANAVKGLYYDGVSSRVFHVFFSIEGGSCLINGGGINKRMPLSDIMISEQLDKAHRIVRFRDGSSCELPDSGPLGALLDASDLKDTFANKLQRSWKWVAASLLMLAVIFAAGYKWGAPYAADKLAYRIPYNVMEAISRQALSTIDEKVLKPSKLSAERQAHLQARFSAVVFPHIRRIPLKVEFRDGQGLGPNAFALPDGTIIFFDQLVNLASSDDELVAVYAHEAGHVAYRHGLRQMIQSSIVALALAAYFGDASSLAGALTGFVLQAKYSRDFERDADRYAANALKANNLQPQLLASFLKKLEDEHAKRAGGKSGNKDLDYLSSHPSTEERMKDIEKNSGR
jgi:Zn-dependent protease with chaperone function